MEKRFLNILVCPNCKGGLRYDEAASELICALDHLAFPINDGVPMMLIDSARQMKPTVPTESPL